MICFKCRHGLSDLGDGLNCEDCKSSKWIIEM